jgi:DNA-binding NarL/FixJ family response regulator
MSSPGVLRQKVAKHNGRPVVPVPLAFSCSVERGQFCDEAWKAIADSLELSPRQVDVARCAMTGQEDSEIAKALNVSLHTVQTYMKRLHDSLGVCNRMELAIRLFAAYHAWRIDTPPPTGCP